MDFLKFFWSKKTLKRKIADIKEDIKKNIGALCEEKIWIFAYGAYDIDPKYLVIWVCVQSDKKKRELSSNIELMNSLYQILAKYDYPESARSRVKIGFESQETVNRESNGDWFHHFK